MSHGSTAQRASTSLALKVKGQGHRSPKPNQFCWVHCDNWSQQLTSIVSRDFTGFSFARTDGHTHTRTHAAEHTPASPAWQVTTTNSHRRQSIIVKLHDLVATARNYTGAVTAPLLLRPPLLVVDVAPYYGDLERYRLLSRVTLQSHIQFVLRPPARPPARLAIYMYISMVMGWQHCTSSSRSIRLSGCIRHSS